MFGMNTAFSSSFVSSAPPPPNTVTVSPAISRTSNGDYWVYTFLTDSVDYSMTFLNVTAPITLSCLAVAGGGGGGIEDCGGGGGGGMVETTLTVSSSQSITIRVGAGGAGSYGGNTVIDPYTNPSNGANTTIGNTITALGGGYGGNFNIPGNSGGSGGGGGGNDSAGGQGIQFSTYGYGYGNDGGTNAGGGGGAGGVGGNNEGAGGAGRAPSLVGIPTGTLYAAGSSRDTTMAGAPNTGNGGGRNIVIPDTSKPFPYPYSFKTQFTGGSGIVIIAILKTSIV